MIEVLEQTETHRVRIVQDDSPMEPHDDGGSPILRATSWRRIPGVEQITGITSYEVHPRILEAGRRWELDSREFRTYVVAFHGATMVDGDAELATLDPKHWRDEAGAPEKSANMDDYRAYLDGEVYGYVVEELVTWSAGGHEDKQEWETVDSCCGFYGYTDYLKETAREALAAVTA